MTITEEQAEQAVTGLEQAFRDAERAAASTLESAQALVSVTRKMQKAARVGNVAGMKRAQRELDAALGGLRQAVTNAVTSWPLTEDEEERYLDSHYAAELRRTATERGLVIHERDGQLISHPSIVRILPGDRAVRVDRKKVSAIRPSHLAGLLLENQKKRSRYNSDRFLESLYAVYSELVREESSMQGYGRVVPLARIYKLFVARPGSGREYDRTDFARDLYMLDANGPGHTRKGAAVSFPASTGTRSGQGLFSFVGPNGQVVKYYGIRFTGGG